MEDRETARMSKYGESKMTRIMMATVPHVISVLGLRKFQADEFLLTRVYNTFPKWGTYAVNCLLTDLIVAYICLHIFVKGIGKWCLSVCLHEQLSSHWMEFCEILYWGFLWKCVKQIQIMLKSDKNNKHFTWSPAYFYVTGLNHGDRQYSLLGMRWG